jgi:hypothetical protein
VKGPVVISDDLAVVLAALDERARVEPRLDRYRVAGTGASALDSVPDGWFVSDAIARLAPTAAGRVSGRFPSWTTSSNWY